MKKVLFMTILPFLLLGTAGVNAQVAIGSEEGPHEGAVLDLSQTATKLGLLLPSVSLVNTTDWQLNGNEKEGEGMLVYNTNEATGKGIYIWNDKWVRVLSPGSSPYCTAVPTISSPAADETKITKKDVSLASALSVTADGKGATPTYQWESSADRSTWTPIGVATTSTTFAAPVNNGGTTYYRCVVTTGCGEATSNVFTVIVCPTAVQDAEGNWYCTGVFGDAGTWMTQNLRTKGTLTEHGHTGYDASLKYYWYPGSNSSVAASTADDILDTHPEYGLLYTWVAATGRTDVTTNESNDSSQVQFQGICPTGWHVPSDYEWNQLEKVIALDDSEKHSSGGAKPWADSYEKTQGFRGTHGGKLRSKTLVAPQSTPGVSWPADCGGFNAFDVGWQEGGANRYHGERSAFWTASAYAIRQAWHRRAEMGRDEVLRQVSGTKEYFNLRCKRDIDD